MSVLRHVKTFLVLSTLSSACTEPLPDGVALSTRGSVRPLRLGEHVPARAEADVVGASEGRIARRGRRFGHLVTCEATEVVFKDEEATGSDRLMTVRLRAKLMRLGDLVGRQWPGVRLRVTEAWDEHDEHGPGSLHYEGRAADLTTSDLDSRKLGQLARLAVEAGLDWVYYEDRSHVHVSVRR